MMNEPGQRTTGTNGATIRKMTKGTMKKEYGRMKKCDGRRMKGREG